MRLLFITQFYEPESIASAFRATEHARLWATYGSDVTVLTGYPNYPTGKIFDGYKVDLLSESEDKGVRLLRSKLIAKPNINFFNRVQNGLSFLWYGLVNLYKNTNSIKTNYDVVLASSGTVFAGYLGYKVAKKIKKPFVIEFRDLTYSQLLATGTSSKSVKYKMMKRLELKLASKAVRVVVLTNSFKKTLIADGIEADKIFVIPNGADLVHVSKKAHKGLNLGYFGAMGISQALPESLEIFKGVEAAFPDLKLLLIGEGAEREAIEKTVEEEKFNFVTLLHGMPKDDLENYYASVDMTVVSLRNTEAFSGTLPSKIFQSWARGIPVVFIGPEGEASELINKSNAGITLCGTVEVNIQTLISFFSRPNWSDSLKEMGRCSQEVMSNSYSRKALSDDMLKILESI